MRFPSVLGLEIQNSKFCRVSGRAENACSQYAGSWGGFGLALVRACCSGGSRSFVKAGHPGLRGQRTPIGAPLGWTSRGPIRRGNPTEQCFLARCCWHRLWHAAPGEAPMPNLHLHTVQHGPGDQDERIRHCRGISEQCHFHVSASGSW